MIRLQNRRITKKEKRDISASVVRVLRVLSNHRTQTPSHLCREITRQLGEWFERLNQYRGGLFNLLPKTRSSNPLSKLVRPFLEHRRMRGIFGVQLVAALTFVGLSGSPVVADFPSGASDEQVEITVVEAPETVVRTTESPFQMPAELIGVSQGFTSYHPGVDLRAPYGSPIHPVTEGVVKDVYFSNWGYGQAIVIEHANGYTSMYAHVSRIFVEPHSNVDRDSVIAEIGMTGHSTGPHLHLEIYKDGKVINPAKLLPY